MLGRLWRRLRGTETADDLRRRIPDHDLRRMMQEAADLPFRMQHETGASSTEVLAAIVEATRERIRRNRGE